jgi:plastocyanin
VRPRTLLLFAFVALLGAVTAVPALATASQVKLEVNENCVEPNWPCWATPGSSQPATEVTIASGDAITFTDDKTAANIAWTGNAPVCESEVPLAPTSPKTGWEGECTFATPGTYKFESSTLFNDGVDNYTKYEIVVGGTPKAKTTPISPQHQTEATLAGSIEPEGNPTEYHFDYGSASIAEHSSASTSLGAADFTSHSVSLPISALLPGTEYHFELIVSYGVSQTVSGGPQTFTTAQAAEPVVSTLAASAVEETEATLNGKVDPEGGVEAEYFFEWGTGSGGAYEHTTKVVSLPSDGAEHQASAVVTGLTPGSEYHFRLVAKNELGSVQGDDLTFMAASTPPAKEPIKEPPAKEPSPTSTSTSGNPPATTSSSPSSGQPTTEPASGPLFGSVKLASSPHGGVVHGSLVVFAAGSESKIHVELLTKGAAAPLGKLIRSSLHGGKLTFALRLSAMGEGALRRHRHLTLTVKITLTPLHGAAVTVTRGVIVHA